MKIIDPHVHFWDPQTHRYPWMASTAENFLGDASAIKRRYLPADLLAGAGRIEIEAVVHVDANHDPADPVEETRWLCGLRDGGGDSDSAAGMPQAIVAACDLSRPDAARILEQHLTLTPIRGIRQILNVHASPRFDYVGRHFMREPLWREQFGLLGRLGLSFDLQLYPAQMAEAAQLAREHPGTLIVLNHAGMFVDRDQPQGWRAWRAGLAELAACPNVAVKISGLAMFDHRWTAESLRPYVLETIAAFGVERSMFASNFPVDGLFGSYESLWLAYAGIVAGCTPEERDAMFRGNARRCYRL